MYGVAVRICNLIFIWIDDLPPRALCLRFDDFMHENSEKIGHN